MDLDQQGHDMPVIDNGAEKTKYVTGGIREIIPKNGRCDLLPAAAILKLSRYFANSLSKYPERNWELGLPMHGFLDSAMRHLLKYLDGLRDEDHLTAACWNIICAMWTEEKLPEMQDIPARQIK